MVCLFACLQGSTVVYAMLASLPEMNDKVSVVIHMGPVAFLDFMRALFLKTYGEVRNDLVSSLSMHPRTALPGALQASRVC